MRIPASLGWILWVTSCSAQTLTIGLYDYSNLSAKETVRLTQAASLVFVHSGIHIVWLHCRGTPAVAAGSMCQGKMQDNTIVVRLEPGLPQSSNNDGTLHLGRAIVTVKGGQYASVFVPAVREQAAEFGVAFDLLLGFAVAHEVGHCLLGPGHSYAGLMRATWNRNDAEEMSRLSLKLTKQEARKAVARLTQSEPVARR